MNNSEMISIQARLRSMVEEVVNEKLANLPVSLPAIVDERKKSTIAAIPVMTFGDLDAARIDDVPIAKSPYFNEPVQKGDFGLLIPCSYFYQTLVTENQNTIDSVIPTLTTGNYVFFPLARIADNPSDGVESEIWSKGKSRALRVRNDRIELGGTTGQATEYTALNTALQAFVTAVNTALASKANGSGSAGTLTLNISGAKKDTVTL